MYLLIYVYRIFRVLFVKWTHSWILLQLFLLMVSPAGPSYFHGTIVYRARDVSILTCPGQLFIHETVA